MKGLNIDIHDFPKRRTQVTCPDCGAGGANNTPCWCYECQNKDGSRVMMLPSCNGRIAKNWMETLK